jgi:hypothetical protein
LAGAAELNEKIAAATATAVRRLPRRRLNGQRLRLSATALAADWNFWFAYFGQRVVATRTVAALDWLRCDAFVTSGA